MQKEDEKKKNIPRNDSYREWILKFLWKDNTTAVAKDRPKA